MIQLTGYYSATQLYFSYERNCIYKIAKFTPGKYSLSTGMAIVVGLGGVGTGIGIYLTHALNASLHYTISLCSALLIFLITFICLNIEYQKKAKAHEYVRHHGICMDNLSVEETYDLVCKESKPFIKATIVAIFAVLLFAGVYVAYLTGDLDDMRAPIVGVFGIPAIVIVFCRLVPVQRAKLVRYLRQQRTENA